MIIKDSLPVKLLCPIKWYENIISTNMFSQLRVTKIISKTVNCYAFPLTGIRFNTDGGICTVCDLVTLFSVHFSDVFIISIKDQKAQYIK